MKLFIETEFKMTHGLLWIFMDIFFGHPEMVTLAHHPVLHSVSSTAVLTMTLPSDLSEAGGIKGSLQSPFSPLDLQV